jgi:hypothetical protein
MKYILSLLMVLAVTANLFAQGIEMADALRSDGKIYVVVAVLSLVLAGILFYVVRTDRKISRLEKEMADK